MKALDDQTLVIYLQSGDVKSQEEAFRYIYEQYYGMVESLVLTNAGTREEVADLFQDSLIVLFKKTKQPDFKLQHLLKTYLYAIARNLWRMKLRSAKRQPLRLDEKIHDVELDEDLFTTLELNERKILIKNLLLQMGEECQEIIYLFYYQKMKMVQIQKKMGLSSEQVAKNKKSKCMKRLRKTVMENTYYQEALR